MPVISELEKQRVEDPGGLTDHNLAELVRSSFSERHYFKNRNKMER